MSTFHIATRLTKLKSKGFSNDERVVRAEKYLHDATMHNGILHDIEDMENELNAQKSYSNSNNYSSPQKNERGFFGTLWLIIVSPILIPLKMIDYTGGAVLGAIYYLIIAVSKIFKYGLILALCILPFFIGYILLFN